MDGENNGEPYFLIDDLAGTIIFGNTHFHGGEVLEGETENFTAPRPPRPPKNKPMLL